MQKKCVSFSSKAAMIMTNAAGTSPPLVLSRRVGPITEESTLGIHSVRSVMSRSGPQYGERSEMILMNVVEDEMPPSDGFNKRVTIAGWRRSFSLLIGPAKLHRSTCAKFLGS